jgi:ATP-binding cassette subfamily B protein
LANGSATDRHYNPHRGPSEVIVVSAARLIMSTATAPIHPRKSQGHRGLTPAPAAGDEPEEVYRPIEWPLVKRLLSCLAPYRRQYALGIALCAVHVLLEMLGPKFTQWIINYTTDFTGGRLAPMPTTARAIGWVVALVGLWALAYAASLVLQRIVILIMTAAGERVQFDLRRRLFEHLQRLSMSYYDRTKLGRIISRCTSDVSALREVNVWGLNTILMNSMMMLVAGIMLLITDWRLFLAVAWLGPVLFVCNHLYRRKAGAMAQVVREGYTRVSTNLAENITGMRVVTAFNRQSPNLGAFNELQQTNTSNNVRNARLTGVYQPLLQLIGYTGKVVILAYGGYLIATGRIGQDKGVGAVVAAYLYWDWFMNPITNLGNFFVVLMQAMAGAERVFSLLDTKPEVQDEPGARPLPRIVGHVKFEEVTFGYHPDRPVLHEIGFEARAGDVVALVGATGSGKSSIISLIARFYQPQKGRVLVDGQDIRHVTGESLHKQMGLVLQVNYLFSGTVLENIRYVRPDASEEQIIAASRAVSSHDAIMQLKDGYQTQVGERGGSMSLGQRQLICFTRAFLADPRIFMLDEATSAVDTATELAVQRSLEKLLEGRTTFIVAHRLSTILRADQILVIDQGQIIERVTPRQTVERGGRYAHLYRQFVEHA